MLLSMFLGMCSFLAISKSLKTAVGLGVAVVFVLTCTAALNYLMYKYLLDAETSWLGVDLVYLKPIVFIMTIAAFVQVVEMIVERVSPVLYVNLGIYLPLITVNCAVLGVSADIAKEMSSGNGGGVTLGHSLALGFGNGVGWMLAICLMAGIREKIKEADIPKPLRGLGLTLIITGVMAMAFMGFKGVDLINVFGG